MAEENNNPPAPEFPDSTPPNLSPLYLYAAFRGHVEATLLAIREAKALIEMERDAGADAWPPFALTPMGWRLVNVGLPLLAELEMRTLRTLSTYLPEDITPELLTKHEHEARATVADLEPTRLWVERAKRQMRGEE